jgi:hypothetical protein
MGYSSLLTTGGYERRPERARLGTVERLHFPIRLAKKAE